MNSEFLARPEDLDTQLGCPGPGLPSVPQEEVSRRLGPGMWMETRVCLCFRKREGPEGPGPHYPSGRSSLFADFSQKVEGAEGPGLGLPVTGFQSHSP